MLLTSNSGDAFGGVWRPHTAKEFTESVGINIRMRYTNLAAWQNWDTKSTDAALKSPLTVKGLLVDSGIKHVRDGPFYTFRGPNGFAQRTSDQRYAELKKSHDIRVLGTIDTRTNGTLDARKIPAALDTIISTKAYQYLVGITGPNEYDNNNPNGRLKSATWAQELKYYQKILFSEIRKRPELNHIKVVAAPLAFENGLTQLGDLSPWIDWGNGHPYPTAERKLGVNRQIPEGGTASVFLRRGREAFRGKPMVESEDGYATNAKTGGMSERAAALYLTRMFLYNFRRGIKRTYTYQLLDRLRDPHHTSRENHFGIIAIDHNNRDLNAPFKLRPKASYWAIKSMLELLHDDGELRQTTPIHFGIDTSDEKLNTLCLQKSDGSYWLVLWREERIWDVDARKDIDLPKKNYTLFFRKPTNITQYGLSLSSYRNLPEITIPKQMSFTASVGSKPLFIRLSHPSQDKARTRVYDMGPGEKFARIEGWTFAADNQQIWHRDNTRLISNTNNNWVIISGSSLREVTSLIGFKKHRGILADPRTLRIESSIDGRRWNPVTMTHTVYDGMNVWWVKDHMMTSISNVNELPKGTKFLKFSILGNAAKDFPGIFEIVVSER